MADYEKVLRKGLAGIVEEVDEALEKHTEIKEKEFLSAVKKVLITLISWAYKCSDRAAKAAENTENAEYKKNLLTLSETLKKVPENAPSSFYEAVFTIYICFSADPDSLGTLDRYLQPFYERDIQSGRITREEAKVYLQELF